MANLCSQCFYSVVQDDARYPDQWYLDDPQTAGGETIQPEHFVAGHRYDGPVPATIPIYNPGRPLAFSFADCRLPVVSQEVMRLLGPLVGEDVQWFPVAVPGIAGGHVILNTLVTLDCLDENRSEFTRWGPEEFHPERLSQYRVISTIRIDPRRAAGHPIFRLQGWPFALLVSQPIKDAIRNVRDLGVFFDPVT